MDEIQTVPLAWVPDSLSFGGQSAKALGLEYKLQKLDSGLWSVAAPNCWIVNLATEDDAKAAADKHFAEQVASVIVTPTAHISNETLDAIKRNARKAADAQDRAFREWEAARPTPTAQE